VLSYLAPALAGQGADVTVVTSAIAGRTSPPPESPVPVVRLPTSKLRFLGTTIYMRSLRKWLTANRPDVIYVSMLKHDAYVAVGVGRSLGIPVVLRPEGAGDTGDLAWQKWGRFGSRIGARCRLADAFVAISSAVHAELVRGGYDESKIHDIPNGVPVPETPWSKVGVHRAVFVGRLAPEKGVSMLLRAWRIVARDHPGWGLMLVGDGPERPRLEAEVQALGLPRSEVQFVGATDEPELWLRRSGLFVLPSREEGMSIALLEAMALGMPIVATDIPGNRRLIVNGVHGRLVPPDDPERLALAILAHWHDPEASARMAAAARLRVIENYSIDAVAERHFDLFDHLIREARSC